MAGYQVCHIIGNVGADPELRKTQSDDSVATFRVAVNETWKDKNGDKQERAEWFRVVAWGKLGEVCGEYLKKGRQVHVTGKMRTREWEKDGEKRFTTELNADTVTFLGDSGERSTGERPASQSNGGQKKQSGKPSEGYQRRQPEPEQPPMSDDDIPF